MGTDEKQRAWIAELSMHVLPLPERTKPEYGMRSYWRKNVYQSLQRSGGLNEEHIEKWLEAQGWTPVRQEIESVEVDDEGSDEENFESRPGLTSIGSKRRST